MDEDIIYYSSLMRIIHIQKVSSDKYQSIMIIKINMRIKGIKERMHKHT